ncbi:MAG: hypothetical protein AB7V08_14670 [Elusimicrobiales bacterium]
MLYVRCRAIPEVLKPGFFDTEFELPLDWRVFELARAVLSEAGDPQPVYDTALGPVSGEEFRESWEMLQRAARRLQYKPYAGVFWKAFGVVAAVLGLPGEAFVDEEAYFRGWTGKGSVRGRILKSRPRLRAAGYRILFELQRRGMSVEEFLKATDLGRKLMREEFSVSGPPLWKRWKGERAAAWRAVWWAVFTGRFFTVVELPPPARLYTSRGSQEDIPLSYYGWVLLHGYEVLGDAFCRLLFTPVKKPLPGVYGTLAGSVVELDRKELVFLAGAARLLCDYKTGGLSGAESLKDEFGKLLGWYLGEEEEGSRGAPGAAGARRAREHSAVRGEADAGA